MWLVLVVYLVSPLWPTVLGEVYVDHSVLNNAARRVLNEENELLSHACSTALYASWKYQNNLTEHNRNIAVSGQMEYAATKQQSWETIRRWRNMKSYLLNRDTSRQFEVMSVLGTKALPLEDLIEYKNVISVMSSAYNTATVCSYRNAAKCDLSINRELKDIMMTSRNAEELSYTWRTWRDNTGKNIRNHYHKFVNLANKAARYNGFKNMADMSITAYEKANFRQELADAMDQVKPLYQQLHAYTRRKLRQVYGSEMLRERGPIPAHLLGNMWAQKWEIKDILLPYPWKSPIDVTQEMVRQGYTPRKLFEVADDFFTSLNLTRMPHTFWRHSVFEEPKDRHIVCHSSAWDFCNRYDYRIKQCAKVTMKDLITAHHEMSHVQYFLQYQNQPYVFRSGANPGFHEAVADTISLSVSTPKHLHRIGLLNYHYNNYPVDMNSLMEMALDKVVFLPFAYSMDLWRWKVLDGTLKEEDWNCGWWDLRYELQGLKPPVMRTEEDFDPAAKFNVPAAHPYDKYFVSFIMQFQFHKALCEKAGEYDPLDPNKPLHKCDIYQSPEAGDVLRDMLQVGSSKPWSEVMTSITGQSKLDATALREYFQPLEEWLITDNARHNEFVGWKPDGEYCVYKEPPPTRHSCN